MRIYRGGNNINKWWDVGQDVLEFAFFIWANACKFKLDFRINKGIYEAESGQVRANISKKEGNQE